MAISNNQIVLDQTIFHPRGGGQPKDFGIITSKNGKSTFNVTDLQSQGEAIVHVGEYTSGPNFKIGDEVIC